MIEVQKLPREQKTEGVGTVPLSALKSFVLAGDWTSVQQLQDSSAVTKTCATSLSGDLICNHSDAFISWTEKTGVLPSFSKIQEACIRGNYKAVEWLLEHHRLQAGTKNSCLLFASVGHLDVFRLLAAKGAHVLQGVNEATENIFDHALLNGTEDTTLWILKHYPEICNGREDYYAQRCITLHRFRTLSVLLWRLARGMLERIILGLIQIKDSICPELCATISLLLRRGTGWSQELREAACEHFHLAFHEVIPETSQN
jgi:hypothetical protein